MQAPPNVDIPKWTQKIGAGLLIAVLILAVVSALEPMSPGAEPAYGADASFSRIWSRLVDTERNAAFVELTLLNNLPDLSEEGIMIQATTTSPQLYLLKITDGTLVSKTGLLTPPTYPTLRPTTFSSSGNGRYIVSLDSRTSMTVIDTVNKVSQTVTFDYRTSPRANTLAISYSGKYIAVGDADGYIAVYSSVAGAGAGGGEAGTLKGEFLIRGFTPINEFWRPSEALTSTAGGVVVTVATDERAYALTGTWGKKIWNSSVQTDELTSTAISYNGRFAVFGGKDNKVYFYWTNTSTPRWTSPGQVDDILTVAISGDGKAVVAGTEKPSGNAKILYWANADTLQGTQYPNWDRDAGGDIKQVAISENGSRIAAASTDDKVYFYKSDGTAVWPQGATYQTGGDILDIALSADGRYLIAGSKDDRVRFWSDQSSSPVWTMDTGRDVNAVALSYNGKLAAAGGDKPDLRFINATSGQVIWVFDATGYPGKARDIAMSWDGRYMVVGGQTGWIYYFDTRSNTPQWSVRLSGWTISPVEISYDGSIVVAGTNQKYVYGWVGANELYGYDESSSHRGGPRPTWEYKTAPWTYHTEEDEEEDDDDDSATSNNDVNSIALSAMIHPTLTATYVGPANLKFTPQTKLVYLNRITGAFYTGMLQNIMFTNGDIYRVGSGTTTQLGADTGTIRTNDVVKLRFNVPGEPFPHRKAPPGTYNATIIIDGIDFTPSRLDPIRHYDKILDIGLLTS